MILGILKDVKIWEDRVICTPMEVLSAVEAGHTVLAQRDCGKGANFSDADYVAAGARIVDTAREIYEKADLVVKVKEFEEEEFGLLRENQIILGCIHPAGHPEQVDAILKSKCIAFTAEDCHRYGSPNCEAAGKQGALFGLESMMTINGGKGKMVGGLAGAPSMKVLILGAGLVGQNALKVLYSLGAHCTVMDINIGVLRELEKEYGSKIDTILSSKEAIAALLPSTDMVLNCVKWPKHRKDFLITKDMLNLMERGSVLVDISVDNPGAIESSRETYLDNPRYVVNGVVHFCVSNLLGVVAHSISVAYAGQMAPFILSILNDGVKETCVKDPYWRRSLTAYKGILTHEETSAIQGRPWIRPEDLLDIRDRIKETAPPAAASRSDNFYSEDELKALLG